MAILSITSYHLAEDATTNTNFTFGAADAIYVKATCTGLTLTMMDGSAVDFGNAPIGVVIPARCTKAVFSGGDVIALQANQ